MTTWRILLARSARPWALLLSCLLLAGQWALAAHDHAHHAAHDHDHAPAGQVAHACDLCVAFAAAAPAPSSPAPLALPLAAAALPESFAVPAATRPQGRAHQSRAPPRFHSA
ncbi:MAG: hypothetical protein MUC71_09795 [Steroidobacteraceae bacterium]|nr:hypothetical protein [Steroidobacteraceae bacterium]